MRGGLEIIEVVGRRIYDGCGNPAVEAEVVLDNGARGRAAAPLSALSSQGNKEDGIPGVKSAETAVLQAVDFINHTVSEALLFEDASDQWYIDQLLLECGCRWVRGNRKTAELLAVSMAVARAAGAGLGLPLFKYLGGTMSGRFPVPVMQMLQGGRDTRRPGHPSMDARGISIVPKAAESFSEALRKGTEVYHTLKKLLLTAGYSVAVGEQGSFMPGLKSTEDAIGYVTDSMELCGYRPGTDFAISLDMGAGDLYDQDNGLYVFPGESCQKGMLVQRDMEEMISYYRRLTDGFPICGIEDGLADVDLKGWVSLTKTLGHKVKLSGSTLFATDRDLLEKGIREGAANAAVVTMTEAGTVSAALEFIEMAKAAGYRTVLSGQDSETEDAFLADFAAAAGVAAVKFGAPCRIERAAKYNELLRIEIFN